MINRKQVLSHYSGWLHESWKLNKISSTDEDWILDLFKEFAKYYYNAQCAVHSNDGEIKHYPQDWLDSQALRIKKEFEFTRDFAEENGVLEDFRKEMNI